jgi:cytochrome b
MPTGVVMEKETLIRVWDPLVRVGHWLLVVSFFIAYLTEDDFMTLHTWAGYSVTVIILTRVVWGFIGTRHARFTDFVYPLSSVSQFLKDTLILRAKRFIGHNPAGGLMILALILSLLITTFSGMALYAAADNAGPFAPWLGVSSHFLEEVFEGIHEFFANLTLLLVLVHVMGVVVESLIHRENLVRAMITGYKTGKNESA